MSEQNAPPPTDSPLLFIYDADNKSSRTSAWFRGDGDMFVQVRQVPVTGGLSGLQTALAELVHNGETFQRCVIDADGAPGMVYFGGEAMNFSNMPIYLNNGLHLEKIFPLPSRIYFNGAHIADPLIRSRYKWPGKVEDLPDTGTVWDFLDAAAKIFLKRGGGVTFASSGGTIGFGPRHHFLADTCWSLWGPAGLFLKHYTT
jgi:hypothetical protein